MFNQIIAGKSLPRHLSSDHDPLFYFHRWLANLRILEVEEIKSIPNVPVSHPFLERLIGTIRREFLDHVLIWNAIDLERKLEEFRLYYNENHVHQSLGGSTPGERSGVAPEHAPRLAAGDGSTSSRMISRLRHSSIDSCLTTNPSHRESRIAVVAYPA